MGVVALHVGRFVNSTDEPVHCLAANALLSASPRPRRRDSVKGPPAIDLFFWHRAVNDYKQANKISNPALRFDLNILRELSWVSGAHVMICPVK